MSNIKTINFLPQVFRSETNKKFLNATLDQLVSRPDFKKINGYIGRQFAPTRIAADSYVSEPTGLRQNYQLEPSVVVKDSSDQTLFYGDYIDLLQQIEYLGGNISDHNRLFSNESYSYSGLFEFDKFINFAQYYWLPDGPKPVDIYSSGTPLTETYTVTRDPATGSFHFTSYGLADNPQVVLAHGGIYEFIVDQPGYPFWIQSYGGTVGTVLGQPNISSREVLGVENNGIDVGTITFRVPLPGTQDLFSQLTLKTTVDYALTTHYSDIANQTLSSITANGGFDGISTNLQGKKVIFLTSKATSDEFWTSNGIFDFESLDTVAFENSSIVDEDLRHAIWTISLVTDTTGETVVKLVNPVSLTSVDKVYVRSGKRQAHREYYLDSEGEWLRIPFSTADLKYLYYQDGTTEELAGQIKLVDPISGYIDIETEILGKKNYISPNGISFTNGLKVKFDTNVIPYSYADKEYYVEEVGRGIRLVEVDKLIPAWPVDQHTGLVDAATPDYITINRSSLDRNAWSRSNRWFHIDVLKTTASYYKEVLQEDQTKRALRPIIEFEPDIQLINYGKVAVNPVDILEFNSVTDAFNQIELAAAQSATSAVLVIGSSILNLKPGMRVIFGKDRDATIANKIYIVGIINLNQGLEKDPDYRVQLTEDYYDTIAAGSTLLATETILDEVINTASYSQIESTIRVNLPSHGLQLGDTFTVAVESGTAINGNYVVSTIIDNNNFVYRDETNKKTTAGTFLIRKSGINLQNWYDGTTWILPSMQQQKTSHNQAPVFDVFDDNNYSLSDTTIYSKSSFAGTTIFSYKVGTGTADPVLKIPLSYRTFNNVGDIQFDNKYDTETFNYLSTPNALNLTVKNINNYYLRLNSTVDQYTLRNVWVKDTQQTKQYQTFNYTFTGKTNYFEIDITPEPSDTEPSVIVYINNTILSPAYYSTTTIYSRKTIRISINKLKVNDLVTLKVYSKQISAIGFYDVPTNLDLNSVNSPFTSLTLGQLRNHLIALSQNTVTNTVSGLVPGDSNLRDLDIKKQKGTILQHASPVIYSNLFLLSKELNFINSIELAQKEYTKFKNKFLELATTNTALVTSDIPASVDKILAHINQIKNSQFPWYYSDMVPYGASKITDQYVILNQQKRNYELRNIFADNVLSNRAIIVYYAVTEKDQYGNILLDANDNYRIKSKRQLIKDIDYAFNKQSPSLEIFSTVNQIFNDIIIIDDYQNTDGCYIPETPTKVGLYPRFVPQQYIDNTYVAEQTVIQGHDGSITPVFGDFRDDLLLELELRIYNNIKVTYNDTIINLYDYIPGKFRTTDYSLNEFNQSLTNSFLKWIGSNRIDYSSNTAFESNNGFTWNFKAFVDNINGERLPGSWRAIYKYFYDTDRPHTDPWEMLGFSTRPTWWIERYGPAPYTGGNLVLWQDLELGYIYGENRYDLKFARPGLTNIIPVEDDGYLKSPEKIVVKSFNSTKTSASWAVGDIGPAENAWRRSSDYPYALQQAIAVLKPAFYFGSLMNVDNYARNSKLDQYVLSNTLQRITLDKIKVNGKMPDSTIQRTIGYINWIGDYQTNLGIDPYTKLNSYFSKLSLRLSYKVAGFTDKNYINILAEQSSPTSTNAGVIIPNENYEIYLNKSSPTSRISYSAVIVKKSDNGWTVTGYDIEDPFFIIIPSLANNNYATIKVNDITGIVYQDFQDYKVKIPYGYEFSTRQQVVDFLISYERYLIGQGILFSDFNRVLERQLDWELSAEEFLTWSQQGWETGNLLILSPTISHFVLDSELGTVDFIENSIDGSKILDQNFTIIKNTDFTVVRNGSEFSLTVIKPRTIGLVQVNIVEYEHALIFDNTTLFNDVIYKPELGNRQYRLKLIGNKTGSWNGQLDIPGFIWNNAVVPDWQPGTDYQKGALVKYKNVYYVALQDTVASNKFELRYYKVYDSTRLKTGLLPNFSYNAQLFDDLYSIDNQPKNKSVDKYSNGLIGFRERSYLTDLGIDTETQSKFYQGYIKQKGTFNAANALTSVNLANLTTDITINEEWALRVGEYGSTESNDYLEFVLNENVFNADPATFNLLNIGDSSPDQIIGVLPGDLYHRPNNYHPNILSNQTFINKDLSIPLTAGYASLSEVDATIYDLRNYTQLDSILVRAGSGYKIWAAKDYSNNWNIYRITETNNFVLSLTFNTNSLLQLKTLNAHSLVVGDIIALKNFDTNFDGFYRVTEIGDSHSFFVTATKNLTLIQQVGSIESNGLLLVLKTVKGDTGFDVITNSVPYNGWKATDRVWADNETGPDQWAVYEKSNPWSSVGHLPLRDYLSNSGYGKVVEINSNGSIILSGSPLADNVQVFVRNDSTENFPNTGTLFPQVHAGTIPGVIGFGSSLAYGNEIIAVGAPLAKNSRGLVFAYRYRTEDLVVGTQVLCIPEGSSGDHDNYQFGYSLAISNDDRWLYVGAPGGEKVYVFAQTAIDHQSEIVNTTSVVKNYVLTMIPTSGTIESLQVKGLYKEYVPYIDFTFDFGTHTLTFTAACDQGVDKVTVTESTYYKLIQTITPDVAYQGRFGEKVTATTDGEQFVVTAPTAQSRSGVALVYDRMKESFYTHQDVNTYTTYRSTTGPHYVTLNDRPLIENIDYTVTDKSVFLAQQPPGGATISIDINEFNLLQVLGAEIAVPYSSFGSAVDICQRNCSVYIGAPRYNRPGYQFGRVYRYVNQGRVYGSIVGTQVYPIAVVGDSIRINGIEVVFTGVSLTSVIADINRAGIQGVTASNDNNQLKILSTTTTKYDRLSILPGTTYSVSPLSYLGLQVYGITQTIEHPGSGNNYFGFNLVIGDDSETLFVSGVGESIKRSVTDNGTTVFDRDTSNFYNSINQSGSVYVYDLITKVGSTFNDPDEFAFVQELTSTNFVSSSGFGDGLATSSNFVLIGADIDDNSLNNAGEVYLYHNRTGEKSWKIINSQDVKVDLKNLTKAFVYSQKSREIKASLDFFDPLKGKILGIAEQEIDYISSYDPARYNQSQITLDVFQPQTAVDTTRGPAGPYSNVGTVASWGKEQVGQLWWNLDAIRYIDYEQGPLVYRAKNWGAIFPGSTVEICEWVESDVPPGSYTGTGTAKFPDNTTYATAYTVNKVTGSTTTKYYYWVVNKTTTDYFAARKTKTASEIAMIIENPQTAGIPFIAALRNDAFNVYGINSYITGTDAILHLDYSVIDNENIIHSEYTLVRENSDKDEIPEKILSKLNESLVGFTVDGNILPDPKLPANQRYGLATRPRQSLFINRPLALKNFVQYVNQTLVATDTPIVLEADLSKLNLAEEPPKEFTGQWDLSTYKYEDLSYLNQDLLPDGYRVLVLNDTRHNELWTINVLDKTLGEFVIKKIQSYRTDFYINYVDWYASGFDSTQQITYIVNSYNEIEKLPLKLNDTVYVANDGTGRYAYYQTKLSSDGFLYKTLVGLQNGTVQISNSLYSSTLGNDFFDGNEFDTKRFDLSPVNETRNIISSVYNDIFIKDLKSKTNTLFFTLTNYLLSEQISTDWIFKSSFISVLHKIKKLQQLPSYIRDNQTYYESYLNEVKPYRTQIREYLLSYTGNDTYSGSLTDFGLPSYWDGASYRTPTADEIVSSDFVSSVPKSLQTDYKYWLNNYSYKVASIEVTNPGVGYTDVPTVAIFGGGGTGATASAKINSDGTISSIEVLTPGSGYTSTPHVAINGTGARDSSANIQITIDDNGSIIGTTIINPGHSFVRTPTIYVQDLYGTDANISCSIVNGSISALTINAGGAGYTEQSTVWVLEPNTEANAVVKLRSVYWRPNIALPEDSYNAVRSITTNLKFDRISYTSNVKLWQANTLYFIGDTVSYNGDGYRVNTVQPWANLLYPSTDLVNYNGTVYSAANAHTSISSLRITFNSTSYYNPVIHDYDSTYTYATNDIVKLSSNYYINANATANISGISYIFPTVGTILNPNIQPYSNTVSYTTTTPFSYGGTVYVTANSYANATGYSFDFENWSNTVARASRINARIVDWEPQTIYDTANIVVSFGGYYYIANTEITANLWADTFPIADTVLVTSSNLTFSSGNVVPAISQGITLNPGNVILGTSAYVFNAANARAISTNVVPWEANKSYAPNQIVSIPDTPTIDYCTYIAANVNTTINGSTFNFANAMPVDASILPQAALTLSSNISVAKDTWVGVLNSTGIGQTQFTSDSNVLFVHDTVGKFGYGTGAWLYTVDVSTQPYTFVSNLEIQVYKVTDIFDYNNYQKLSSADFTNANDRTLAYYSPTPDMTPRDLARLFKGIEYPGVTVTGARYDDSVTYTTNNLQFVAANSIIKSTDISMTNFIKLDLAIGQTIKILGSSYNDGLWTISQLKDIEMRVFSKDTIQTLQDESAGSIIGITYFNENNPTYLDTIIESTYLDTALGTRPEDINVDGGKYVDTYSSHAPEEFIPGRLFDHVNIEVYTKLYNDTKVSGYRIVNGMYTDSNSSVAKNQPEYFRITENATTALRHSLSLLDSEILVDDAFKLSSPGTGHPGIVYINGEKIHYYRNLVDEVKPWYASVTLDNSGGKDTADPEDNQHHTRHPKLKIQHKQVPPETIQLIEYTVGDLVSFEGNTYRFTANTTGTTFDFGNVELFNPNVLTQIRRGVDGTGAPAIHYSGTPVVDSSNTERLLGNVHYTTWLNAGDGVTTVTDGTGLEGSIDPIAKFIKEEALAQADLPH